VSEAKSGQDVDRYERAASLLKKLAPNEQDAALDTQWMENMRKSVRAETERLENELKGYKNNLIKESIRVCSPLLLPDLSLIILPQMGNEDLGSHYHAIGDLLSSTKAYARMRDFCTTPAHIASMCFRIIAVAVDRGDWLAVQSNVQKIRSLNQKPDDHARTAPKLSAVMGLSQLATGAYRDAASSLLSTDPALTDTYSNIITSNDVAVYGGLCALATMDRCDLSRLVLENASFRNFLELEPHIRRAISFFCASKYSQCLEILEAYRPDYLLDVHLQRHISPLYSRIRSKAIVSYFVPFSCVTLDSMGSVFASKSKPIEQELSEMISSGKLDARLDLQRRVLVAQETNPRAVVHEEAQEMARKYARTARLRLLRMNASYVGVEVKAPARQGMMRGDSAPEGGYVDEGGSVGTSLAGDVFMGNGGDGYGDGTYGAYAHEGGGAGGKGKSTGGIMGGLGRLIGKH
jgi:COP9 signalosome complex subunit 1